MTNPTHDQKKLQEYRERAAELYDLSQGVQERMGQAAKSGAIEDARTAFGELTAKTKEFEDFRKTLTPTEIFIATYNVVVVDEHTVSFVVPRGVAPIDILKEAQGLVTDRDLIEPRHLNLQYWSGDPKFTTPAITSERLTIDGHVPNSSNKDRAAQDAMVGKENLPTLEQLAVAFAVNWIATGEPLFGWYDKSRGRSLVVRAAGGALRFFSYGLSVDLGFNPNGDPVVAVSSRAPRLRQGLDLR